MALGLSLSLSSIPGVSSLLSQLDSYKAAYLAVPARIKTASDKLTIIRQAMAASGASPASQSDALTVTQHLADVQSEWNASASDYSQLSTSGGSIGLGTLALGAKLLSSVTYVLSNMSSIESSVNNLGAKYLTPTQQAQVNMKYASTIGGGGWMEYALLGGLAYLVLRKVL
jgi:hypothetical protein